jgi:4-diphosphocytidyl-2-C-methyl-D-erythritol kinase
MIAVRLQAHAKINWTLEALGKRPDGYHEIRTIMQTIDLADTVTVRRADNLTLSISGAAGLASEPSETNLAHRAAVLLRSRAGYAGGAAIELQKAIPVAAGLGGGSSDAAAVLRGLRTVWQLDVSDDDLEACGRELGSDVPFFVRGGTALASGRGDVLERLPEPESIRLAILLPEDRPRGDKTAMMYAGLRREHHTDGSRTAALVRRLRSSGQLLEEGMYNVFERVAEAGGALQLAVDVAATAGLGQVHLCGAGPALVLTVGNGGSQRAVDAMTAAGFRAIDAKTVPASISTAIERVA